MAVLGPARQVSVMTLSCVLAQALVNVWHLGTFFPASRSLSFSEEMVRVFTL